jgi:hypothetical protein
MLIAPKTPARAALASLDLSRQYSLHPMETSRAAFARVYHAPFGAGARQVAPVIHTYSETIRAANGRGDAEAVARMV